MFIYKLRALFFVFTIFLISCAVNQRQNKIISFSDNQRLDSLLGFNSGSTKWKISTADNKTILNEDSLKKYNCIVIPFSRLNKLNYRDLNVLKRFLEVGEGGVVGIKDTAIGQNGWDWLMQWNQLNVGDKQKQDNGRLFILNPEYTRSEIKEAINYVVDEDYKPDYNRATTIAVPDSSRYTKIVLTEGLDEPMEMGILPNNNVLFVERKGGVKIYNAESKQIKTIANLNVFSGIEDGLLGVALDPDFKYNNWAYFYYAPAGKDSVDRLSRFELIDDNLVLESEKVILEVPTQRLFCCHSAGSVEFGPDGLLYVSIGDNTNAEATEGYTPVDERLGHELADDQATAANSNDLRGKILRIKPEPDGTYSIPEGNLFPKGTPKSKPEIYAMGLRNPFRITIDRKTNYLYWGDVGPDTKVLGRDGSFMSYDEINLAIKPGFYGWPYFLGDNDAFPLYDFATKKPGARKDELKPINASKNNTGIRELPPAQSAMIWYGKGVSKKFPLLGSGGASAMTGPVYYSDLFPNSPYKLSNYYDGKLLIYDWIRHWIMAVTLDQSGNYVRMEPFIDHISFSAPIDMKFGSDGALYVLEYGTNWFSKNSDARLVRIEYQEGNRNPIAVAKVDKQFGASPLTVKLSSSGSKDYDKMDELIYSWLVGNEIFKGESIMHTFKEHGEYKIKLTVEDNHGGKGEAFTTVSVGNNPPLVQINSTSNKSFFWDNASLNYSVQVNDVEDKFIDPSNIQVSFGYLASMKDVGKVLSRDQKPNNVQFLKGQQMIASLDCNSCHSMDKESVGPSYKAVAKRYLGNEGIKDKLVQKIIEGGSGSWGTRPMSPHPHLSPSDTKEIVNYILSLSEKESDLSLSGNIPLLEHKGKNSNGAYLFSASYTDKGANGIKPLKSRDNFVLRNPKIEAEDYDDGKVGVIVLATQGFGLINKILPGSYIKYNKLDLTSVKQIKYRVQPLVPGGNIELRLDSRDGKLISSVSVPTGKASDYINGWKELTASIDEIKGEHDLYFVFSNEKISGQYLFNVDWIYFMNK